MSVGAGADAYYNHKSTAAVSHHGHHHPHHEHSDASSIRTSSITLPLSSSGSILPPTSSSDGISLPSMPFDKRPPQPKRAPPSSAIMKEQLQYYMKKHLQTSKSNDSGDLKEESRDVPAEALSN